MTDSIKACSDCIHFEDTGMFAYCRNLDYSYETKDYINGKIYTNYSSCAFVRDDENRCGDEARGWVENPNKEPEFHESLWSAFKGMIKALF